MGGIDILNHYGDEVNKLEKTIEFLRSEIITYEQNRQALKAQFEAQRRELEAAREVVKASRGPARFVTMLAGEGASWKKGTMIDMAIALNQALAAYDKEVEDGRLPRNN